MNGNQRGPENSSLRFDEDPSVSGAEKNGKLGRLLGKMTVKTISGAPLQSVLLDPSVMSDLIRVISLVMLYQFHYSMEVVASSGTGSGLGLVAYQSSNQCIDLRRISHFFG